MGFLIAILVGFLVSSEMSAPEPAPELVVEVVPPALTQEPVYMKDRYYRNDNGYLITDLGVTMSGAPKDNFIVKVHDIPVDVPLDQIDLGQH